MGIKVIASEEIECTVTAWLVC